MGLRLRLLGWALGLLVCAVAVSLVVVHQTLINQVNHHIDTELRHEASAFSSFVASSSGRPFDGNIPALTDAFLSRFELSSNEAVFILVDGRLYRGSTRPPSELSRDDALVRDWASAVQPKYGQTARTEAGPARWLVVPIAVDGQVRGHFVVALFSPTQEAQITTAVRWTAVACLLVLLLAASGGYLVMGRALRPLRMVTETAREIKETDLSRRIEVRGSDQVADLAATFNGVLDHLEQAFATRRAFLSDTGHNLRTPITVARRHLEAMRNDPTERAEATELAIEELARMSRLVDDLLLLADSEQRDLLQLQVLDVATLLQEVHAKARALADRRWQLGTIPAVQIRGDRRRLTQALMQLALNAAQHTEPGDTIRFFARTAPGEISLSVEDTGPGIAPGEERRIFDRFVRAEGLKQSEGTGLGLAIVKAIAEVHQGTATVTSAPGSGATFTLNMPSSRS